MTVLITGAGGGIGLAAAKKFTECGHSVIGIDISHGACDGMELFAADVTSPESLSSVANTLSERGVALDAIVCIAGIHRMASLVEDGHEVLEELMRVNLIGTMHTVRAFHALLSPRGRVVILTSEVGALDPLPFNGLYSVSKCALESYAQALRQELNLLGQSVVTVRPGAIATPLANGSIAATEALAERTVLYSEQASRFSNIAKRFMGKPISPERLAPVIYRAATAKRPRLAYSKHKSPGLVLLGILPKRTQCFIIKLLLGGKKA